MTAAGGSVAIGVRLENWSGYTLTQVSDIQSHRLVIYTHTGKSDIHSRGFVIEWQYGADDKTADYMIFHPCIFSLTQ